MLQHLGWPGTAVEGIPYRRVSPRARQLELGPGQDEVDRPRHFNVKAVALRLGNVANALPKVNWNHIDQILPLLPNER